MEDELQRKLEEKAEEEKKQQAVVFSSSDKQEDVNIEKISEDVPAKSKEETKPEEISAELAELIQKRISLENQLRAARSKAAR